MGRAEVLRAQTAAAVGARVTAVHLLPQFLQRLMVLVLVRVEGAHCHRAA